MIQPLVSVIIPTYNRVHYLKQTLSSVLGQSYPNLEVIVVDDGTPNVSNKELCEKFKRVTYIKIDNSGGASKPRNIGIEAANGEYVAFVDDDDIWVYDKIEKQVNILEKNKDFGLAHSYCNTINEKGEKLNKVIGKPGTPDVKHGEVYLRMIGNWTIMNSTPLVRKSVINEVGFFNEIMPHAGEDVEYWSRCAFHTKFFYIDEPLVFYRQHKNNVSNNLKAYVNLPLYLLKSVKQKYKEGVINKHILKQLELSICLMQSKNVKKYPLNTICNLFRINVLWFTNFRVQKTIIKKIIHE